MRSGCLAIRFGLFLAAITIGLFVFGINEIVQTAKFQKAVTLSFGEFVKRRPTEGWYRITGCKLAVIDETHITSAGHENDPAYIHSVYMPVFSPAARCLPDAGSGRLSRAPPYTGVWNQQGKLAALGVKLSGRMVTYHGFSLNCTTDLSDSIGSCPAALRDDDRPRCSSRGERRPPSPSPGELVSPFVAHVLGLRWEAGQAADLGLQVNARPAASASLTRRLERAWPNRLFTAGSSAAYFYRHPWARSKSGGGRREAGRCRL